MANILIRNLPEDLHTALRRKAERRHQSLQQYLVAELRQLAERRPIGDVLEEIEERSGGQVGLHQAVLDLGDERARG